MGIKVNQVGKRWFICTQDKPKVDVEVSYGNGAEFVVNDKESKVAGYKVWDHIPTRKWNITGLGAKKHREEIITAIETYLQEELERSASLDRIILTL